MLAFLSDLTKKPHAQGIKPEEQISDLSYHDGVLATC